MKKTAAFLSTILILICISCTHQMSNTELQTENLVSQLISQDDQAAATAHKALVTLGEQILPILIQEMNKPEYLSSESGEKKFDDPKWQMRERLAGVIQDISGQDFLVYSSASGWNPDHSFNLINAWWNDKQNTPNQRVDLTR